VQTNIIGTQNVIRASLECGVKKTVFTSTDKAIAPTNTYGASKLMAERLISAAQYQAGPKDTVFAAVRFGNVMGSRGSVIPLFESQIREKGKITITRKDMTRFMMTLKQATELTLQAMQLAQGGEVFILKMPVVRLIDLAESVIEEMAEHFHFHPSDIVMEEIGLRPGEKMYEELLTEEEAASALELDRMFILPNLFLKRNHDYAGAVPAQARSYNSANVLPIGKDEIKKMLRDHQLLSSIRETKIQNVSFNRLGVQYA
jgi:FlaA1/EpsC-like NDP-sugar epimerase